jgi:hypothetical protein
LKYIGSNPRVGILFLPVPVNGRYRARVCFRPPAGNVGSNLAGGKDVCVVCCKYGQKAKFRIFKTRKQVQMAYTQGAGELKKLVQSSSGAHTLPCKITGFLPEGKAAGAWR